MRTKTTLLTAALIAAGALSSMAQSNVYSLNIVGYVNLSIAPGFNLITLPLQSSDLTSSVNSVLTNTTPVYPGGSLLYTYNSATGRYNDALQAGGDGNWYDQNFNPATNSLPPGQGFFLQNLYSSNVTVTVVGSVLTGTNSYPVSAGYGFYGNEIPLQGDITTNGFPAVDGSLLYTFNSTSHTYNSALNGLGTNDSAYDSSGNLLGTPSSNSVFTADFVTRTVYAPAVGSGFIYFNPSTATAWTQTFTVQ